MQAECDEDGLADYVEMRESAAFQIQMSSRVGGLKFSQSWTGAA